MTDIEKLARDICWAGFHNPPTRGKIKYWREITPNARASYIETAKEFTWIANRLGRETVVALVFNRVPEKASQVASAHERSSNRT